MLEVIGKHLSMNVCAVNDRLTNPAFRMDKCT